jgi:hypothetical protein
MNGTVKTISVFEISNPVYVKVKSAEFVVLNTKIAFAGNAYVQLSVKVY